MVVTTPQVTPVSVLMPLVLPGEPLTVAETAIEAPVQPDVVDTPTNEPAATSVARNGLNYQTSNRTYRTRRFRR